MTVYLKKNCYFVRWYRIESTLTQIPTASKAVEQLWQSRYCQSDWIYWSHVPQPVSNKSGPARSSLCMHHIVERVKITYDKSSLYYIIWGAEGADMIRDRDVLSANTRNLSS